MRRELLSLVNVERKIEDWQQYQGQPSILHWGRQNGAICPFTGKKTPPGIPIVLESSIVLARNTIKAGHGSKRDIQYAFTRY